MNHDNDDVETKALYDRIWAETAKGHQNIECWPSLTDKAAAVERLFDLLDTFDQEAADTGNPPPHHSDWALAVQLGACENCTRFLLWSQTGLKISDDGWFKPSGITPKPFTTVYAALVPPELRDIIPDPKQKNYRDYLQSDHWLYLRQLAFEHYGKTCQLCGKTTTLQVHHRTYERLGRERLSDLTVLCDACHTEFHNGSHG